MTIEIFVQIVWTVFAKVKEKSENGWFLANFGIILARFLTSLHYEFDQSTHKGP